MRKNRPASYTSQIDQADLPPALTGALDHDTTTALAFLWAHKESWLAEGDAGNTNPTGDAA